jgi:hypothetical protein
MTRIGSRAMVRDMLHEFRWVGTTASPGYDLIERHPIGTDCLELWIKVRHAGAEGPTSWREQ